MFGKNRSSIKMTNVRGKSVSIINGIRIEVKDGVVTVDARGAKAGKSPIRITKDGRIEGDVTGNIEVTGSNVTVIVEGDVTGNITGAKTVKVQGDTIGNVVKF